MNSLFGIALPQPYLYVLALVGILVLIIVAAYILRHMVKSSIGFDGSGRGRQPRLGIVDSFSVDRQRQLVIIRRDNVEHLILIGGNSDIVIETNIVRANIAGVREAAPLQKMSQQPNTPQAVAANMTPLQDPMPKAPIGPFNSVNSQPARFNREDTDIRPSDFAEIARHFERPADVKRVDSSLVSDRTLPPIAHDPFATDPGNQIPLTATHDPVIAIDKDDKDQEAHKENDPLSAPIIPLRNDMSPTEGLRRLLGRNGETS